MTLHHHPFAITLTPPLLRHHPYATTLTSTSDSAATWRARTLRFSTSSRPPPAQRVAPTLTRTRTLTLRLVICRRPRRGRRLGVPARALDANPSPDHVPHPSRNPGNASAPLLFARSTDYSRTLLSAAGLLLGLLRQYPPLRPSAARPISLLTEPDEPSDIMHGVGLASSSKRSSTQPPSSGGGAETSREGRCPAASRLARKELSAWRPEPALWSRLIGLFGGASMDALRTTGIADALYASACHDLPPPCGAAGCVDTPTQAAAWHDADTFYCSRYAGGAGGLEASQPSMAPDAGRQAACSWLAARPQ